MAPLELHAALAKTHPRSAQVLAHRLLDDRSREECAALYGLTLDQWDVLFLRSAQDFERALGRSVRDLATPEDGDVLAQAHRLADALNPELRALAEHREELQRLIAQALRDYEASGAYRLETWARTLAIIVIVALTIYFYWRDEQGKKPVPYAPYLTEPRKP
jgi:hypothetical protein